MCGSQQRGSLFGGSCGSVRHHAQVFRIFVFLTWVKPTSFFRCRRDVWAIRYETLPKMALVAFPDPFAAIVCGAQSDINLKHPAYVVTLPAPSGTPNGVRPGPLKTSKCLRGVILACPRRYSKRKDVGVRQCGLREAPASSTDKVIFRCHIPAVWIIHKYIASASGTNGF
jgi:hypothetical protein